MAAQSFYIPDSGTGPGGGLVPGGQTGGAQSMFMPEQQSGPPPPVNVVVNTRQLTLPASGGETMFTVINHGLGRAAVKIMCSNNNNYRVNPPYAIVEPSAQTNIQVIRLPGPPSSDFLLMKALSAGAEMNPRNVFTAATQPPHEETINITTT